MASPTAARRMKPVDAGPTAATSPCGRRFPRGVVAVARWRRAPRRSGARGGRGVSSRRSRGRRSGTRARAAPRRRRSPRACRASGGSRRAGRRSACGWNGMLGVMRGSTWSPVSMSRLPRLPEAEVAGGVAGRPDGGEVPARACRGVSPSSISTSGCDDVDERAHRHGRLLELLELVGRRAEAAQHRAHALEQVGGLLVAVVDERGVGRGAARSRRRTPPGRGRRGRSGRGGCG